MIVAFIVVLAVGLLAFLMRGKSDETTPSPGSAPGEPSSTLDDEPEDDDSPHESIAITSDGWAFVPDGHGIQLFPPAEPDEGFGGAAEHAGAMGHHAVPVGRSFREGRPGERMSRGDLIAARVKRGAPGVDPWRLEALGRDREYRHWPFETQDAATAALGLFESRIVPAREVDPDPDEPPIGDADFVLARAEAEAIEAELASSEDLEPPR